MKKFLLQIFIFGLIFLSGNLLIYRFITYDLLFKEYEIKAQKLQNFSSFIFSDSHGWIVTLEKPESEKKLNENGIYNFSYGSDSYIDILYKLDFLLRNNISVDTLLISADDHLLSPYRENRNNKERSIHYSRNELFLKYYEINQIQFFYRKYIKRFLPLLYSDNSRLLRNYFISVLRNDDKQNNQEVLPWADRSEGFRIEQSKRRIDDQFPSKKPSSKMINALEEILKISKKNNIVTYGLKFPLSPSYNSIQIEKSFETDSIFENNGFRILNFKSSFKKETYFSDTDHINSRGSKAFVDSLLSYLNNQH